MAGITLDSIRKSFGETEVLKSVSLDIADGAFVTLVGPSGCGKSTLLRIIAGLEGADGGAVRIGAQDVTGQRPADRNLAMVFQSYALYPHLSVAENMLTPLKMRDMSALQRMPVLGAIAGRARRAELMKQVQSTAETLQISHLLDRKPGQLSGGQRQRVALGRAMVRQPAAFLMDEPLSNLDAALRVHMRAELSELHRRLGATFVYVTHDQAEALTMSDKMAVMMGGRVLQYGPPDEVYTNPASLEVAGFIGSPKINILPAEADAHGRVALGEAQTGLRIAGGKQAVSLGLRPEHLVLATHTRGLMRGKLRYRENLGSDVFLHIELADGARVLARSTPEEAAALSAEAEIALTASPARMLAFGPDGARIAAEARAPEVPA